MYLNKDYDYPEVRTLLMEWGYTAHIRARDEEARDRKQTPDYRARRRIVERTHSWPNRFWAAEVRCWTM